MIKNKLIVARKEKNVTQHDMADLLFMSQSQYQRRERGEIRISDEEWVRIAKFLGKEVEDIKEDDHIIGSYSTNCSSSDNYYCNIPESMVKNQQDYIEMLKQEIKCLKEEINRIHNRSNRAGDL